jgi:hypothetical protein
MRILKMAFLVPMLAVVACVSEDPADGGFYNGVAGVSQGTYDKRVAKPR